MIIFKKTADLTRWLLTERKNQQKIGFVPTMGALHAGHISLINISKKSVPVTICSIFVNPTQFNDPKDFQKYPVTLEKDIAMLETAGAEVLFLPEVSELYPDGTQGLEKYELGELETLLEGKYRPGHFQGVCQVMRRLLEFVRPDELFMGQKDYQQCMVVQRLLEIMGMKTGFHAGPIVREADGLAMSSRNLRLTGPQRQASTAIYRALSHIREEWKAAANSPDLPGTSPTAVPSIPVLTAGARATLEEAGFRVDYVEIADAQTLHPLTTTAAPPDGPLTTTKPPAAAASSTAPLAVALIAAFQGEIRLIDNMLLL